MPINSDGKEYKYPPEYSGSNHPEKVATKFWDDWELEQEERLQRGVGDDLFCWLKINDHGEDGYETK